MSVIVPPGGFVGYSMMTPASKAAWGTRRASGPKRRRKSKKTKTTRRAGKRTTAKKSGRKMKFGSPAWQKKYKVGKFRRK